MILVAAAGKSALAETQPAACPVVEAPAVPGVASPAAGIGVPASPKPLAGLLARNPAAGLYVFESHVDLANWRAIYHAAIASTLIDGAAIMLNWKSLEPSANAFCWGGLDVVLADVLRLGKTFGIGLVSGGQAPIWLYDTAGVPALRDIPFNPTLSRTGSFRQKLNQPLVWDDRYLRAYAQTMEAIARHSAARPASRPSRRAGRRSLPPRSGC